MRTFEEHLEVTAALFQINENIDIRRLESDLFVTFHECKDKQQVKDLFANYGLTIKRMTKDVGMDIYTATDYTSGHKHFFLLTAYVPLKQ